MHPWRSKGEKRTVVWEHEPDESVTVYLRDMQDAIRYALQVAYRTSVRDREGGIPSPIALRHEVRDWFNSRYDYARHHINPVCRTAVAMLKSHRKRGDLRIPEVKRLAMRVDSELFKIVGSNNLRITLRPKQYVWLPINTSNKHYAEYSRGRASELLITDRKVCLTFVVNDEGKKKVGESLVASDLNFRTVD